MLRSRLWRMGVVIALILGVMMAVMLPSVLAQSNVLLEGSGRSNHWMQWGLYLGDQQAINVTGLCTDASGTGLANIHDLYISINPAYDRQLPWHIAPPPVVFFNCKDGINNAQWTAPYSGLYDVIFHVHTNEYGSYTEEGGTGISNFNYSLRITSGSAPVNPPPTTPPPTEEPTALPTEEPTAAPTEEPTAAPTEEPTAAPTEEPTAAPPQTTDIVVVGPTTPLIVSRGAQPDGRLNWRHGDFEAVIYRGLDDQGQPSLVVYGINENAAGFFLCTITEADLGIYASSKPDINTLVKTCGDTVTVYVLITGEVQVNIVHDGKIWVTIVDGLAAAEVKRVLPLPF